MVHLNRRERLVFIQVAHEVMGFGIRLNSGVSKVHSPVGGVLSRDRSSQAIRKSFQPDAVVVSGPRVLVVVVVMCQDH